MLLRWFAVPAHWYVVGFVGQFFFSLRFIVQWIASEFSRRPVLPRVFWYLSLCGGVALLAYAIHRRDPVLAGGQGAGLLVYARNLILDRKADPARVAIAAQS